MPVRLIHNSLREDMKKMNRLIRVSRNSNRNIGLNFHPIMLVLLLLFYSQLFVSASWADMTFGVTPYLSEDEMHASFDPILSALSRHMGERVNLYIAKDYSDLSEKMKAGLVDIGAFSPFAYVEAVEKASVRLFATHCVDGKSTYKGLIIARKDKGYREMADLSGKIFAFVDPKSASGFIYPRAMIVKLGHDPDVFFKKTIFAGAHDKVIDAVFQCRADAGATFDGALKLSMEKGLSMEQLTVLWESEPIPYDAYTVRNTLPETVFKKIQAFFLGLSKDKEPLKSMGERKKGTAFSGWINGDDSLYNVVRETAAYSGKKQRIAMWGFTTTDKEFRRQKIEEAAGEMLSSYLVESRRFTVVQPTKFEETLLELKRNLKEKVDDGILSVLLQRQGIDLVITGDLQRNHDEVTLVLDGYDTRKKERAFTKSFSGKSIENLDQMIENAVLFLQIQMPHEAYILGVREKEITVNSGSDDGVRQDMKFEIINLGEETQDPSNAGALSKKRRKVGEGRFRVVKSDTATGEITSGDVSQIDVGSRIRILESAAGDYSHQNRIYANYIKGLGAMARGDDENAIESFKRVIEEDPDYAMAHAKLSTAYFNRKMRKEGFTELEKAKSLINRITFQERNYILAREATEHSDFKTAIGYYQKILERYPLNTSALHNLGMIYSDTGYPGRDMEKASDYFKRVIEIDPDAEISRRALNLSSGMKGQSVDVVVVFDTTGSMSDSIKGMIKTTESFADILSKHHIDYSLGLVTFGDEVRNTFSSKKSPVPTLSKDVKEFKTWLKSLEATGGGDEPENAYDAMMAALSYNFRPHSKKIILLITDAPPQSNNSFTNLDEGKIIDHLKSNGATVFVAGPDDGNYTDLSLMTGGKKYSLGGKTDFTGIIKQIGKDITGMF